MPPPCLCHLSAGLWSLLFWDPIIPTATRALNSGQHLPLLGPADREQPFPGFSTILIPLAGLFLIALVKKSALPRPFPVGSPVYKQKPQLARHTEGSLSLCVPSSTVCRSSSSLYFIEYPLSLLPSSENHLPRAFPSVKSKRVYLAKFFSILPVFGLS